MHCRARALHVGATLLLSAVALHAADFADPTLVNLLRRTDTTTHALASSATVAITSGASYTGPAGAVIDGGHNPYQYNWPNVPANFPTNGGSFQITLPEPVTIATLAQFQLGVGERALNYRWRGSLTGFGSMTELVPWTATPASDTISNAITPTVVKYLSYDFYGLNQYYLRLSELKAYAPAGASIPVTESGYNLFDQRATAVVDSFGPAAWTDGVATAIDLNSQSYLRNQTGAARWAILDLGQAYALYGAGTGYYHGQDWRNWTLEGSLDKVTWTPLLRIPGSDFGGTYPFASLFDARYVRLWNSGASGGALCELELFALPEPASGLLAALGALALLRRRR